MGSLHDIRIPPKAVTSDFNLASLVLKPSSSAEQLDNLYFREKDASRSDQNELNESTLYELNQLDAGLEELFRDSHVDFDTHHQIHKYRLRISRRIGAFAGILRRLLKHSEIAAPSNRLKLQSLHRFYAERLMRHKNKLSEWWSRNERRYHSMCLSSFVSEAGASTQLDKEESDFSDDESALSSVDGVDDSELVTKLKATRSMMLNQLNQMSATESSMLKSSNYIVRQEEILTVLKKRFGTARQLFKSVRRRTLNRYGTVRLCYFTFLGACGFITLRRFRIFKLVYGLTRLALAPAFYVTRFIYRDV